jgi:hypothetical protein
MHQIFAAASTRLREVVASTSTPPSPATSSRCGCAGPERILLTVADYDRQKGTVTIVIQALRPRAR